MLQAPGLRPMIAASATVLAVLGTATAAQAAAVTVTGDDGNPVPLAPNTPASIRNMSPSIGVGFAPTEDTRYSVSYAGPDGVAVATAVNCFTTKVPVNRSLDYRGNGTYTIVVTGFAKADSTCQTPKSTETYTVVITGSVAVGAPAGRHLIRKANSYTTNTLALPFSGNPGATSYEIAYAKGGVVGPDGGLSGPIQNAYLNRTTGLVEFLIREAGTYTVVARASAFAGSGKFFTPWSAPITINAISPFDLTSLRFPDSRGPSYQLRGTLRDTKIRGRVSLAMARGKKGGKYRSIGRAKISSKGTFTKRFTQRRTGTYRIRIKYSGSKTAAAGTIVQTIRITRRFAL
jgi:hypothetical protein